MVYVSVRSCRLHLSRLRLRPPVSDVIGDGVVEEDGVLGDDADQAAEGRLGHRPNVLTVHKHRARL